MPLSRGAEVDAAEFDFAGVEPALSSWTASRAKRAFDMAAVILCAPLLAPLLLAIAIAVLVASGRPILFRQVRIGRSGKPFSIFKFRTMQSSAPEVQHAIATLSIDHVTPLGRILRRVKLDELPQVLNVLAGDMSLVGPRPKVPAQQTGMLVCRPGITGPATLFFAREERMLKDIAKDSIPAYYRSAILPAKMRLDADYARHATLVSDLRILIDTVLGNW